MENLKKFVVEFGFRTSPTVLYSKLSTPSGLADWFASDVNVSRDGKTYTFIWDQSEEDAELISKTKNESVKFKWESDETDETYFEFSIKPDPITNDIALLITDFAEEDDIEDSKQLWSSQIDSLRNLIGA